MTQPTLRVLVADDHADFLNRLVSLLETEFPVVGVATNGQAALEGVKRHRPDVVVLDLEMPVLNGIETARKLKKLPFAPAIVICSANTDPEIVAAAREAGAMAYVFKRCMSQDLVDAVKSAASSQPFISSHCEDCICEMNDLAMCATQDSEAAIGVTR